jgi:sugar lactone lactonase YvrE
MRDLLAIFLSLPGLAACAPAELPLERAADLLIADVEAGRVLRLPAGAGAPEVLVDAAELSSTLAPEGLAPAGLALRGEELWVSDMHSGRILAFDMRDGQALGVVFDPGAQSDLEEPCALAWLDGALAVLGNDTRNVLLVQDDGAVGELGGSSPPQIRDGHGLLALPDGRLLVATSASTEDVGMVQVWDAQGGERIQTWLPPGGPLLDATGLALGPEGLVYVVDWSGEQVLRMDPDTGQVVDRVLGPESLSQPVALAFDEAGRLWILERHGLVAWAPVTGPERVLDEAFSFGRGLLIHG